MPRPPRPRPVKAKLPGQRAKPTKQQQKPPPKKPWTPAEDAAKAVGNRVADAFNKINPFD